jgi:hypothetical protein
MGTGNSKASLAIQVENTFVVPGTVIKGKIYLDVMADKVDGEALIVRLTGTEFSNVIRPSPSGSITSTFLDMPFVLSTIPKGYFVSGQYEFPFQFTIPTGVLPSMQAQTLEHRDDKGNCSVHYRLEARLHRRGLFKWDVRGQIPLQVHATPLPFTICPAYIPPEQKDVHFCFCYPQGQITMGIHMSSTLLQRGQEFIISYLIQNNSNVPVLAVEFTIEEQVCWYWKDQKRSVDTCLFHQRIDGTTFPPQLKHPAKEYQVASEDMLPTMEALKQLLDSNQYLCQGRIANTARFTMEGQHIFVSHNLIMKVCTSSFWSSNPDITIPITIYSGPITEELPITNTIVGMNGLPIAEVVDWRPSRIAPVVAIPLPTYRERVEGDIDLVDIDSITSAPAPASRHPPYSIESLYYALQHTYSPANEVKEWVAQSRGKRENVNSLTADQLGRIFSHIPGIVDQLQVNTALVEARSSVTCDDRLHYMLTEELKR